MKWDDFIWAAMINLMSAYTGTMGIITVAGFKPGQWQYDVTMALGMLVLTPVFYSVCREVFGKYVKITIEGIEDETVEETSKAP